MDAIKTFLVLAESRLVDGWRQAWRWSSVQILAIIGIIELARAEFPDDFYAALPEPWATRVRVGLLVAVFIGRIIKQPGTQK